jgi:hypothetical protein
MSQSPAAEMNPSDFTLEFPPTPTRKTQHPIFVRDRSPGWAGPDEN